MGEDLQLQRFYLQPMSRNLSVTLTSFNNLSICQLVNYIVRFSKVQMGSLKTDPLEDYTSEDIKSGKNARRNLSKCVNPGFSNAINCR